MGNPEFADLPWRPPAAFTAGRPGGPPRFITIHYTAGHEGYADAENGAAYDMVRADGTSAHFYVDADSTVQCVATWDRSHTALYHGNLWGIHLELCGTAQTREQWLDEVSRGTIRQAAAIAARCMAKYGIPNVRLGPDDVRNPNAKGLVGHYDWTVGWPEDGGDHTDPGPAFPWDVLQSDIEAGGDDMSAQAEAYIEAMFQGLPAAGGATNVFHQWQTRADAFQTEVKRQLAENAARDKATQAAIGALTDVINTGGGSVDTAPILARIDAVTAAESAAVRELQDQVADLRTRLAAAAQAEADKLASR